MSAAGDPQVVLRAAAEAGGAYGHNTAHAGKSLWLTT